MGLSLDDKHQIEELLNRYSWWIDSFLPLETFYDIFTEDAILVSPISGRFEGREGLDAFVRYRAQHPSWGEGRTQQLRHMMTNVLIEGHGESAVVRAHLADFNTVPEGDQRVSRLMVTGHYHCDAVKIDGTWKLRSRILFLDPLTGGPNDNSERDFREVSAESLQVAAGSSDGS